MEEEEEEEEWVQQSQTQLRLYRIVYEKPFQKVVCGDPSAHNKLI